MTRKEILREDCESLADELAELAAEGPPDGKDREAVMSKWAEWTDNIMFIGKQLREKRRLRDAVPR